MSRMETLCGGRMDVRVTDRRGLRSGYARTVDVHYDSSTFHGGSLAASKLTKYQSNAARSQIRGSDHRIG